MLLEVECNVPAANSGSANTLNGRSYNLILPLDLLPEKKFVFLHSFE